MRPPVVEIHSPLVKDVPDLYGRVGLLTEESDSVVITVIQTSRGKWSAEPTEGATLKSFFSRLKVIDTFRFLFVSMRRKASRKALQPRAPKSMAPVPR
jgi:hypothetical protein